MINLLKVFQLIGTAFMLFKDAPGSYSLTCMYISLITIRMYILKCQGCQAEFLHFVYHQVFLESVLMVAVCLFAGRVGLESLPKPLLLNLSLYI